MQKQPNWSRLLGWVIFGLVIAGGPLLNAFQQLTGVQVPSGTLPALIVLLMVASVVASMGRRIRSAGDQPANPLNRPAPPNAPMPPFAGESPFPRFPARVDMPASSPMPDTPEPSASPEPVRSPR